MSGMLQPEIKETIVGVAQVREVFRSSKFGVVAGCLVTEGVVKRNNPIRVLRDNVVIFEGALESLRRFKDDVGEVRAGTECGIGVKNYQDVRVGDQIECYSRVEVATNGAVMAQPRTQRIESQIQRVLAELIAREVKDPRVGNVTITAVSCAADMGSGARVLHAVCLDAQRREQVAQGLTRAGGFLRGEVGRQLGLRHAPRLEFVFDDTRGQGRAPHRASSIARSPPMRGRQPHERYGRRRGA